MSSNRLDWQMTVVLAVAIMVFGGGTMALLIIGALYGHDSAGTVPGALWAIDGGLANAIVSSGAFFTQRQMHAAALWHLAQTVPAPATSTVTMTSTPTTGESK